MAYTAAADRTFPALPAVPATASLQRAMMWLLGASGAIVFIEPSPYELVTLLAMLVFFATGMRVRLVVLAAALLVFCATGRRVRRVFLPLALLLFLINLGYSIAAAHLMEKSEIVSWVMT